MGVLFKLGFIITIALAVLIGLKIKSLYEVPPLPPIEDTWWGPKDRSSVSSEIQTFKISFPEKVLHLHVLVLPRRLLCIYILFYINIKGHIP